MHSSQFGITFTDSRGPVNSDGPIHCIRSLNRMVRYSVMPLPAEILYVQKIQYFTLPHVVRSRPPTAVRTVRGQSEQSEDSPNSPRTVRTVRGQSEQSEDSPNSPRTVRTVRGQSEQSEDSPNSPRTVRTVRGQSEQSEDSPNGPRTARPVRGQSEQSEDSPSSPSQTLFSILLRLCSDCARTLLGLC